MNRRTIFAIVVTTIAAVAGLSSPSALAQQGNNMGAGMEHGMMGADKDGGMMGSGDGGGMMGGGMMGRGMMGMTGGGCPMMGMMMGGGDMPMYREGRIAFLKAELAITDAQAKVWDAYADALKKNMQSMQDMHKSMMAARAGKTPVERLDAHVTAMEGRLQALKDIKPALAALYEALSDDQKKKADQLLTSMGCMM
jgi:LTXXQ motif family protein